MPAILAVDIGTSSMKGGIVDIEGSLLSWARVPLSDGLTDFKAWSPRTWEDAFVELVAALMRAPNARPVAGVCLSGNGPTLVALDKTGEPLDDALMWLDGRAESVSGEPSFFLPKAAWLKEHDPERYAATDLFLPCAEYLNYRLTGVAAGVSPSHDFDSRYWTKGAIERYGLSPEKFPPLIRIGDELGRISARASLQFGLDAGLPVYASGSDFLMALVGTGAVVPGRTCDRAGTSEGINYCTDTLITDPGLRTLPHAIEGLYNVAGILSSTGRIFEWFRTISGQHEVPYDRMLLDAASLAHQAPRPYFFPSLHRGAIWEFSGGIFTELEPDTGTREMGRAVVEAIGFSVRDVIHELETHGCPVDALRVTGGQARNDAWSQMKSNITGKRIMVPAVVDAELIGSACAGFVGAGDFRSLTEAAEALVRFALSFEPDPDEHARFSESYHEYREVRDAVIGALESYRNRASNVE